MARKQRCHLPSVWKFPLEHRRGVLDTSSLGVWSSASPDQRPCCSRWSGARGGRGPGPGQGAQGTAETGPAGSAHPLSLPSEAATSLRGLLQQGRFLSPSDRKRASCRSALLSRAAARRHGCPPGRPLPGGGRRVGAERGAKLATARRPPGLPSASGETERAPRAGAQVEPHPDAGVLPSLCHQVCGERGRAGGEGFKLFSPHFGPVLCR